MDKLLSLLTETYSLLGLGFGTATLFAVLLAPGIWRKAATRTRRRVDNHTQSTMQELGVDKEKLRSQLSVTSRKLDLAVEDWQDGAALQLIKFDTINQECSTTLAQIELHDDRLAKLETEVSSMRAQVSGMHKEVKTQLNRITEQSKELSLQTSRYKEVQGMLNEASVLADKRKVEVVTLRKQIANLNARIDQASDGAKELRAERAELHKKVEHAERELNNLTEELELLRDRLARRDVEVADLNSQLVSKQRQYNAQTEKSASSLHDLKRHHDRELDQLRADYEAKVEMLKEEKARLEKEIGTVLRSLKSELIRERATNDQMRSDMNGSAGRRTHLPNAAQLFDEAELALAEASRKANGLHGEDDTDSHGHPFRNAVFNSLSGGNGKPALAGS